MNLKLQRLLYRLQEAAQDDKTTAGGAASGTDAGATVATGSGDAGGTQGDGQGSGDGGAAAPAADAAAGAKGAGSADKGNGAAGKPAITDEGPWGKDWREKAAKGDEAKLRKLSRYADPTVVVDSLVQLHDRIARGELKSPLPKDATPEQVKAWRTENGIPEAPEKYSLGDLKIDEKDKPIIDSFLKTAHGNNLPEGAAKAVVDWYYDEVGRQTEARAAADKAAVRAAEDALRQDWGNEDYRANINGVMGFVQATFPEAVRDLFLHGRLADGTPIMANPDVVKGLLNAALEINPAVSMDLPSGSSAVVSIDTEIASIEKEIAANSPSYYKDEKKQERYRGLLDAREKLKARG